MIDELVKFFILFFVVVEPITLVPLFAGLTEGADESFRRRMHAPVVREDRDAHADSARLRHPELDARHALAC